MMAIPAPEVWSALRAYVSVPPIHAKRMETVWPKVSGAPLERYVPAEHVNVLGRDSSGQPDIAWIGMCHQQDIVLLIKNAPSITASMGILIGATMVIASQIMCRNALEEARVLLDSGAATIIPTFRSKERKLNIFLHSDLGYYL
jgi:hypothetical protein